MDHQITELNRIFDLQKSNYSPANSPSYSTRIDRLNRLDKLIRTHFKELSLTIQEDFGTRSADWAFTADVYSPLDLIKKVKRNLKKWMAPEKRSSGLLALTGQRTYQINEPLGVVGIMSPFNAPVSLALDPAIEALGAGNTVIIKISEQVPKTADLMQRLVAQYFKEEELAVITGEIDVSVAFASKPWDKFFFTGGSETGKKILEANAKNLTPAILELGGKSPCVVLDDANMEFAAKRIGMVRQLNAGQICISGDYAFVPKNDLDSFVDIIVKTSEETYPNIIENRHFTSIINNKEFHRIVHYIDEAKQAGCKVIEVNPGNEAVPDLATRKIPLTLVINPPKDLKVARYEVFGPVLTVFSYTHLDEVIAHINANEKPLALYVFGKNQKHIDKVVNHTSSGGVTINDLFMHANAKDMGFGGVGYSGMGRYKGGKVGFYAFTNPKTVFKQGLMGKFTEKFFPPFKSESARNLLRAQVRVK
ncbi:aldehyde dehydrogenase family protein [Tamlana sp. 2201CG12-4]|uniref:aldehyde dehydrogenase family protein n=1 Tax=Tamlana sp. 2201CG12-4 TaxID=3112582 RepID=UPI002DBFA2A7|nr:aldehyde dehydrogenase family protein [Tamlana sp. 2201CG12-4]MEC3908115.1 aldehyde dehydrogenase family protein [Tamlana sp. 2201CG12-4]